MNTNEIVSKIAERQGLSKAETRRLLDTIIETLTASLEQGESFTLPGLGTFEIKIRDERRSYNPHYQQYMMLPPKRLVHFKPSKTLKEEVK